MLLVLLFNSLFAASGIQLNLDIKSQLEIVEEGERQKKSSSGCNPFASDSSVRYKKILMNLDRKKTVKPSESASINSNYYSRRYLQYLEQVKDYEEALEEYNNLSSNQQSKEERPESPRIVRRDDTKTDGMRRLDFSFNAVNDSNTSYINLNMRDLIISNRNTDSFSRCTRRYTDATAVRDYLNGTIKISFVPDPDTMFYRLDFEKSNHAFSSENFHLVENSITPSVKFVDGNYLWIDQVNDESSNNPHRVSLTFRYNNYSRGVGTRTVTSNIAFSLTPLPNSDKKLTYAERINYALDMLSKDSIDTEKTIIEMAPLVYNFENLKIYLKNTSLADIREVQNHFFEHAIRLKRDMNFIPLIKAMAATISTKMGEFLSEKLIPLCTKSELYLPLTDKTIKLQRYKYLTFYLQRLLTRLESYEPQNTFGFITEANKLVNNKSNALEIRRDDEIMAKLSQSYEAFQIVAGQIGRPIYVAQAEYLELIEQSASYIVSHPLNHTINNLFSELARLETDLYVGISSFRNYILKDNAPKVDLKEYTAKLENLNSKLPELNLVLEGLIQKQLFSETTNNGIEKAMLQIFESTALIASGEIKDVELYNYFTPIFNKYFDLNKLNRIAEQSSACIRGEL